MITTRQCPACGAHDGYVLHRINMRLPKNYRIPGEYDIVCCDICGNCYADVDSDESDYDDYYENLNYYGGWNGNSSGNHDLDVIIRTLKRNVKMDAKIVDVGFGNGRLLQRLKKEGFTNLLGIDPSEKSVQDLKESGVHAVQGSIYKKPECFSEKADAVIFTMVLEHLLYPEKAISAIKENLLMKQELLW